MSSRRRRRAPKDPYAPDLIESNSPESEGDDGRPSMPAEEAIVEEVDQLPVLRESQPRIREDLLSSDNTLDASPSQEPEPTSTAGGDDLLDEILDSISQDKPSAPELLAEPQPELSATGEEAVVEEVVDFSEEELLLTEEPVFEQAEVPDLLDDIALWEKLGQGDEDNHNPDEEDAPDTSAPTPQAQPQQTVSAVPDLGPKPKVVVQQGLLAGPSAVSLISAQTREDQDELNHVLGTFAELEPGQRGFIRLSIRNWPEFKGSSREWLQASKTGQDVKKSPFKSIGAWGQYLASLVWFHGNRSSKYIGGGAAPVAPGKRGEVKPLRASEVDDETKQAWKEAELKARDSAHFEVDLRVGVIGKEEDEAELERVANELAAGFEIYRNAHQEIVWSEAAPYDALIGFMGTRLKDQPSMALSAAEVGALAYVPDDTTNPHGVRISRSTFKQLPISNPLIVPDPLQPPPGIIPLGIINPNSEDAQVIGLGNAELDQHLFYSGRTGTGKSEMMKWLVFGVAKDQVDGHGFPLVVIDPHGALSEDLLNMLIVNAPERIPDIVYCDIADDGHPVALNPLDVHSVDEIEPTVSSVMEMLSKQMALSQSGAPRAVIFAQQALTALCYANLALTDPETKCTLLHVVTFFIDSEFRRVIMEFCENPSVREAFDPDNGPFEQLSEKQQTEFSMPIIRAFSKLGTSQSLSAVFSAGENRLDFGSLIAKNKIIIVKLARFSHQAELGEFVGSLILPWTLSTMDHWGRKKDPETGQVTGSGCRIFVDEAPTLFGPNSSVPQVLAEARKWNLGLIFASQMLSQFDKSVIDATLGNTASKIALGLEMNSARMITNAITGASTKLQPGDIAELPNYHFYGNVLLPGDKATGRGISGPFSAKCMPMIDCDLDTEHKKLRDQVIQRSQELICNPRDMIENKQRSAIEDIKQALGEELRQRIAESPGVAGGQDLAIDLDQDPGQSFQGWS